MEQTKQTTKSPVVREYKIGDITYIVKAVVKARYNAENVILLQTDDGFCGIIHITCLSGCRNRR